jgi:hypothetical protein
VSITNYSGTDINRNLLNSESADLKIKLSPELQLQAALGRKKL